MGNSIARLMFDRRDRELLNIVNEVQSGDTSPGYLRQVYYPHFHPLGIKELAESKGLRIAYATINLLASLGRGHMEQRLVALQALRDEILNTAEGPMPKNTARVLLQIMKELVRAQGNEARQLALAHDFRTTASGKPRIVRRQMARYHLVEMPEAWNQIAFDHHVHDVNTKGRKSATHLIMDAWIKGIRRLRVVYYNYISPASALEILEAARIMQIDLRLGIEFPARFGRRYVKLIWVPRGFSDTESFLCFLAEPAVAALMDEGRAVSAAMKQYVLAVLSRFNRVHRPELNRRFGVDLPAADEDDFLSFVAPGQPSLLHLAKYLHARLSPLLNARVEDLRSAWAAADEAGQSAIEAAVAEMNRYDSQQIVDDYLCRRRNVEVPDPETPGNGPAATPLLELSASQLLERLRRLHPEASTTINLSGMDSADVIGLLYAGGGLIDRLELFNLKDYTLGKTAHLPEINALQQAINTGNPIVLKDLVRGVQQRLHQSPDAADVQRAEALNAVLFDIDSLLSVYRMRPLQARIGSDSTGQSRRMPGMGLVVRETLPLIAQRRLSREGRQALPLHLPVYPRATGIPRQSPDRWIEGGYRLLRRLPVLKWLGYRHQWDWDVQEQQTCFVPRGNVMTLGGIRPPSDNGLTLKPPAPAASGAGAVSWANLNSQVKNVIKVAVGFIPAFATFALTKDWWLLAYGGAFIWFGITGLRNILQSVLGGGGLRRSPLLRWNDYVSWTRITDSLLYTGFSVPLLDYLVKTVLLDRVAGITTATAPTTLYAVMALANGIYISSHNAFRGLPRGALVGNFFRSLLSIPLAVLFNAGVGMLLGAAGVPDVNGVLQKWAAVISKTASDCVAGVIEGTADRAQNIRKRCRDCDVKLRALFAIYARLELLFPQVPAMVLLQDPSRFKRSALAEVNDLGKILAIHALDLLYFYMYQPRGRSALKIELGRLSAQERQIFLYSQRMLRQQEEVCLLFVNGVLGRDFSRALAFYLDRYRQYLTALDGMLRKLGIAV